MKIATIETFDLTCPLNRSFGWSQGWINQRGTTLVKITTDDGLTGWGEGAESGLINNLLAPLLIGQDPIDRAGLWERMFHALYNGNNAVGLAGSALSALDIALWDLAGKAANLPICALLGGKIRDKIAVYATGLYYTEGEFPNRLLDEARGRGATVVLSSHLSTDVHERCSDLALLLGGEIAALKQRFF